MNVKGRMNYLAREEKYRLEKPYHAEFPTESIEGAKLTNHTHDVRDIIFHDMRAHPPFDIDANGACVLEMDSPFSYEDIIDEASPGVIAYVKQLERVLYSRFSEYTRIEPLDVAIRRRSPDYPQKLGPTRYAQPAASPHADFSRRGAFIQMSDAFPGQEDFYKSRDFDMINAWRVLRGPNNDWPLAICDAQTVDVDQDCADNDVLQLRRVGENCVMFPNEAHRWYYLSDQMPNEIFIFRNISTGSNRARGFHSAFHNLISDADGPPRESLEARFIAFRD